MRSTQWAVLALIGVVLVVSGCKQGKVASRHEPVKLEESGLEGIKRVILEPRAAERIGLETAQVLDEAVTVAGRAVTRKIIPYGALMYDKKGDTWTFTSPAPLTFIRQHVVVEDILDGDRVILAEGPIAGTVVVTVGAAELMGAEHRYGAR